MQQANPQMMLDMRLARDPQERALAAIGIPRRYWHLELDNFKFRQIEFRGQPFSSAAQRHLVKWLCTEAEWHWGRLIVIASDPTDNDAMALGSFILQKLLEKGCPVGFDDIAYTPKWYDPYPRFLLLHNIFRRISDDHVGVVQKTVNRFGGCTKLLLVGGVTDPWKFSTKQIGYIPNYVIYVSSFLRSKKKKSS